jgi:AcrR family transcriptional regulator
MLTDRSTTAGLSPAKARILEAALELFSEHGIAGTSLQMIADRIGVTKAAVYHQFNTKDEIVHITGTLVSEQLGRVAELAAAQTTQAQVREVLAQEMIALAVDNRHLAGFLQRDPVMLRLFEEHEPFRRVLDRLNRLLMGRKDNTKVRVTAAALMIVFGGAVTHPLVAEVDDETLRRHLMLLSRSLLGHLAD